MKKLLFLLALLWASPAFAQNSLTTTFINSAQKTVMTTQTSNARECFAVDIGLTNHALTFIPSAGISALTVTVTGNSDGSGAFPTTAGTSTTLGATISFTGTYAALCVTITAFTGAGTVNSTYYGNTVIAAGGTSSDGLGADTYVAYWNSASQLGGDSGFRYNQDPTAPTISLVESDGAVSGKWWANGVATGVQTRSLCGDTGTGCVAYETVTRSGTSVTTMALSATTITAINAQFNGTLSIRNSAGVGNLNLSDAGGGTGILDGSSNTNMDIKGSTAVRLFVTAVERAKFISTGLVPSTDNTLGVGSSTLRFATASVVGITTTTIAVTGGVTGNVSIKGGTPVVTGNGTLQLGSQNFTGRVDSTTTGSATITITFSSAFTVAPVCFSENETTVANVTTDTESTTALVITGTTVTGDDIAWHCFAY